MTVVTTNVLSGPYTGTGAANQQFPVTFHSGGADQVRVWADGIEVDESAWTFNRESDGTGVVVATLSGTVYVASAPDFEQDVEFQRNGPYFPDDLNAPLDAAAIRDQYLKARVDAVVPDTALLPGAAAGKFLSFGVDSLPIFSTGTGTDTGLRADLAGTTGGQRVGTTYGSAQSTFDQLFVQGSFHAMAFPPMPDGKNYADVWPTATNPMAAARDTGGKSILIRVWRASGSLNIIDEWILRDPDGAGGIAGGYQIVHERAFVVNGRMIPWHTQPTAAAGPVTTSEFALNVGPMAQPYSSAANGPEWAFAGFGHGRMLNTSASNQITLNGAGSNLQSTGNWAGGARLNGQNLNIACTFTLLAGSGDAHAMQVVFTQLFGVHDALGNQGMIEAGVLTSLLSGYGYNDSYTMMMATQRSYADSAKLAGDPLVISLVGDNAQKGNWNTQDSGTVQFYNSRDPRFIKEAVAVYGPSTRINGSDTPHFARNSFGRTHMQDSLDNAKFRMFGASSIEGTPRTAWALPMGDSVAWLTYRRTEYRAGGPL
jgi:hypothetical protein